MSEPRQPPARSGCADLTVLGEGLRRSYPPAADRSFADLLGAIDRADVRSRGVGVKG